MDIQDLLHMSCRPNAGSEGLNRAAVAGDAFHVCQRPRQPDLDHTCEHATQEKEDVNVLLGMAAVKDFKSLLDGEVHDLAFDLQG